MPIANPGQGVGIPFGGAVPGSIAMVFHRHRAPYSNFWSPNPMDIPYSIHPNCRSKYDISR